MWPQQQFWSSSAPPAMEQDCSSCMCRHGRFATGAFCTFWQPLPSPYLYLHFLVPSPAGLTYQAWEGPRWCFIHFSFTSTAPHPPACIFRSPIPPCVFFWWLGMVCCLRPFVHSGLHTTVESIVGSHFGCWLVI